MTDLDSVTNKKEALNAIISLTHRFSLQPQEIISVLEGNPTPTVSEHTESSFISKFFAYLGAVFIMGGLAAFVSLYWESFNSFSRVSILLIPGFTLYLLATLLQENEHIQKIFTPLYIAGYILELVGLYVFLIEYFEHTSRWGRPTLFVFGILFLQQMFTFLARKHAVILFCSLFSALWSLLAFFDITKVDESYSVTITGTILLFCTYCMGRTTYKNMTGFWYFIGSVMCLGALFDILERHNLELLILLPTCFLVYLSTFVKSKSLLFVSIVSLFSFLGYFTEKHFADSLGWPLLLLLLGVILFALSLLGVKIGKRFI